VASVAGPWWVSDQRTGLKPRCTTAQETKEALIVTIPPADPNNKNTAERATPTGTIFNGSQKQIS